MKAWPSQNWIFFFIVVALSASLRFYKIGDESYWLDEMTSLSFAKHPMWSSIFFDNTPFFYPLLLKGWVGIFGDNEFMTRSLSALFSIATTGLLFWMGVRWNSLVAAVAMGLLHAINPISITYAQETRGYALFELVTAFNMVCFYFFIVKTNWTKRFTASVLLLFMTSYLSVGIVGIETLWIFLYRRDFSKKRIIQFSLGIVAMVLVAVLGIRFRMLSWLVSEGGVNSSSPLLLFWNHVGRSGFSAFGYLILFCVFGHSIWKGKTWRNEKLVAISFLIIPILGILAISAIFPQMMFRSRHFIFTVPFFTFWAALTIQNELEMKSRRVWIGLAVVFGVLGFKPGVESARIPKSPWREAAAYIGTRSDMIILTRLNPSVSVPYFEKNGVPVRNWEVGKTNGELVRELLEDYSRVCIMDTQATALSYFPALHDELTAGEFKLSGIVVNNERSEPIDLMFIEK